MRVTLERVATLEQPLAIAIRAGDPALYMAEKTGRVMAIRDGRVLPRPVLDLRGDVSLGGEQGLLGLAFSPDGQSLYVNYTDVDGDTRIVGYAMQGDHVPSRLAPPGACSCDQPYDNHNGGDLVFGPDGDLYIGLGDGGSGGDPQGNGQSLGTLLGKMLRDRADADGPRAVPRARPTTRSSATRARDPRSGPTACATHGGIRSIPPPATCGSPTSGRARGRRSTGCRPAHPAAPTSAGTCSRVRTATPGTPPPGAVPPVYEYPTPPAGCVVIGGAVYRGSAIPALLGAYVFADFCCGHARGDPPAAPTGR